MAAYALDLQATFEMDAGWHEGRPCSKYLLRPTCAR